MRKVLSVSCGIFLIILFTSFSNPNPLVEVIIKNYSDESIFIYYEVFEYLKQMNVWGDAEVYGFDYFSKDIGGGVQIAPYPGFPNPSEIKTKREQGAYYLYVPPRAPVVPGFNDIPIDEQFRKIYKKFSICDKDGNILLDLEEMTDADFVAGYERPGGNHDWYLIIR